MKQHLSKSAFDLNEKTCVVIGAGLIGSEFAKNCAQHGAQVVIADSNSTRGEEVVAQIAAEGGKATFIACDASTPDGIDALIAHVKTAFGNIDAMVNAIYPRTTSLGTSFEDVAYDDFLETVSAQSGPQFLSARAFGAVMKEQGSGSIVLMGSIYGVVPPRFEIYEGSSVTPPAIEYALAKGGLATLTQYLAKYYGPYGVRVNMLSPGGVWDNQDTAFEEKFNAHVVLGNRMATPDDLSPTLVYLFSEASRYVTGQNLVVDGGWTL